MENILPVINKFLDVLPWLVISVAALVSAMAYYTSAQAKANPGKTWHDDWAPFFANIRGPVMQAVEWLGKLKGWSGSMKIAEALKITNEAETLWKDGRVTEAIMRVSAFLYDAQGKADRAGLLPPPAVPPAGSQMAAGSWSR